MEDQNFQEQLTHYAQGITNLEDAHKKTSKTPLNQQHIIDTLLKRDAIEENIKSRQGINYKTSDNLMQLAVLDKRLKALGVMIAKHVDLSSLRTTLNHQKEYWWWYFKPPLSRSDRFDWIWNALTAGALALAASFMYNIYSAFVVGNANFATALSAIIQVAGLAIIGGGALTDSGKQKLQLLLSKLNVPKRFYAEVTFILSLVLLSLAFITNNTLDDGFLEHGQHQYQAGKLDNARIAYLQAQKIDPDIATVHNDLAQVYESQGKLTQAVEQYSQGSARGELNSLLGLGRVLVSHKPHDLPLSESYLLMALQRAENNTEVSAYTHYQLNRNMGWVLLNQKKYTKAIEYLGKALEWRSHAKDYSPEGGTGNCFLAYAYEQSGQASQANSNWKKCIQYAKPDYIHEYRWLIEIGKHDIAACVDTSAIVGGYQGKPPLEINQRCQQLLAE